MKEPPILFADMTPSRSQLKVRRGGMKLVRLCSKCNKPLSRKTARLINEKLLCSACLFPPLKKGVPQ